MIDIHCHILPGLDDGAPDLSISMEMAQMAVAEGITTIIATPHHLNGRYENTADRVELAAERFNRELIDHQVPLKVLCGQETRIHERFLDEIDCGNIRGLNETSYILLELPSSHIPKELDSLLHELSVLNLIPIIAHPERNAEIFSEPHKLLPLLHKGALSQVTAHSVTGLFGSKIQKVALELCQKQLVHFIASDAHHPQKRPFGLKEAYTLLRQEVDDQTVDAYMHNAESLILGGNMERREPSRLKRKKWYMFWN